MRYAATVDRLRRAELDRRAGAFAERYDPQLPTVLLVPGGMGSRLLRADTAHAEGLPYPDPPGFEELWLTLQSLLRPLPPNFTSIRLDPHGIEIDRHPIIPSGELSSFIKTYDETERFFRGRANYVTFGFDWRKDVAAEAGYLLLFLERLQDTVRRRHNHDPLPELTLLAHSMGGLITKLAIDTLIERRQDLGRWFARFVSAATPFYGTATHARRLYTGDPLLNRFAGGPEQVARISASLPGPYILLPAPAAVLQPRLDRLQLERYPVRNASDPAKTIDPFDHSRFSRYPRWVSRDYLDRAAAVYVRIDREPTGPVREALRDRLFHLRLKGAEQSRALEFRWAPGQGFLQAAEDDAWSDTEIVNPVRFNADSGQGDGTVPLWSARLAWARDDHVYDVTEFDPDHGSFAESAEVLETVHALIQGRAGPDLRIPRPHRQPLADRAEAEGFLVRLASGEQRPEDYAVLRRGTRRRIQSLLLWA